MENKDRLFQIFSKKLRGVLGTLDVEPEGLEEIRMRIGRSAFYHLQEQRVYGGCGGETWRPFGGHRKRGGKRLLLRV